MISRLYELGRIPAPSMSYKTVYFLKHGNNIDSLKQKQCKGGKLKAVLSCRVQFSPHRSAVISGYCVVLSSVSCQSPVRWQCSVKIADSGMGFNFVQMEKQQPFSYKLLP